MIATDADTSSGSGTATSAPARTAGSRRRTTTDITLTQGRAIADKQAEAYAAAGLTRAAGLADLTLRHRADAGAASSGTELTRDGLRGPVLPIALGGSILALLLVGAAGSYWADRRSREVRLLSSRGVGPGALALKAVLELGAAGGRGHRAGLAGRRAGSLLRWGRRRGWTGRRRGRPA